MTDRPTPETDKIIPDWMQGVTKELPNFVEIARKLERERDELLAYLDAAHYATCNAELRKERDEAMAKYAAEATDHMLAVNKLCNERDEARKETEYYKERYEQLKDERDEAREQAQQMSESNQVLMADVRFYRDAWEQLKDQYGR